MSSELSETEVARSTEAPKQQGYSTEPPAGKGGAVRKLLVVLVIVLVVGAAVWKIRRNTAEQQAENDQMAAQGDRPTPVLTSAVERKSLPVYLSALGTVTAYNTVTIKTRVDGQLMRVNVREGQAVREGQLLIEIDPKPYEAAVAQAEGQLARDQATAKNAQAESARYTALREAGVVSRESEQSQISLSGQAEGAIQADRAAIQAAKVNVGYTKILSPITGVVGLRQVDAGNIVHAADTTGLLVVTQLQPIAVIFTLPEDQLPQVFKLVRGGRTLTVEAYDRSSSTHLATGSLLTLDNQIDTTTGTDKVKAVFNNADGALFPNQFVNIRLVLEQREAATVIPAAALQTGSTGSFVYLLRQGKVPDTLRQTGPDGKLLSAGDASGYYVVTQPVRIDVTEGTQLIVASGLQPGDQIVVDGQERLRNGARVIPRAETPAAKVAVIGAHTPPPPSTVGDVTNLNTPGAEPRRVHGAQTPNGTQGRRP
jgi:multidrug efflux system membrane fusion protein